jgi:hypothetical protein
MKLCHVQGIILEFEIGRVLEIVGGCCERSEQKNFHIRLQGVFFASEHPLEK